MALYSGFFNSLNGDRKYNAAQIGRYLHGIITSGVYANVSDSLQVLATGGMTVAVQPGRAMLDFQFIENDEPYGLTIAGGGSLPRYDIVVLRLDMDARTITIEVKEGTPSSSPAYPSLVRTDVVKEYMLAAIYVGKLATALTQSNITDTRADTSVCGWVVGAVRQVDTSTLFAQWQAAYNEAISEMDEALAAQQQTFEEWFKEIAENFADGSGLPMPTPANAGEILAVNETGDGYTLLPGVKTDETLSQPGQAADAAATGEAISEAIRKASLSGTNPNLLDNWYFADPINQRGKSSYSGTGYGISRWTMIESDGTVTLGDGGLTVYKQLRQFIENPNDVFGKEVTASVLTSAGVLHTGTMTPSANNGGQIIFDDTNIHAYIYVVKSGDMINSVSFIIECREAIKIEAVKLEFGEQQTLARQDESGLWVLNNTPPNKTLETLKCNSSTDDIYDGYANNPIPKLSHGTHELTAGVSELESGKFYFMYE